MAALAPRVPDDVRGFEVRLSFRRRHIDVVVFRVGDEAQATVLQAELHEVVTPLASQFDGFADYTTEVLLEACGEAASLIYRGVPVWERSGTRWELDTVPRELGLLVQA